MSPILDEKIHKKEPFKNCLFGGTWCNSRLVAKIPFISPFHFVLSEKRIFADQ
jgi:hypothetical protein